MNTPEPKAQKIATITFTEEEARVTVNLLDAAVKSLGLNAAEAAVVLAKKFNTAYFKEVILEGQTGPVGGPGDAGTQSNVVQ